MPPTSVGINGIGQEGVVGAPDTVPSMDLNIYSTILEWAGDGDKDWLLSCLGSVLIRRRSI